MTDLTRDPLSLGFDAFARCFGGSEAIELARQAFRSLYLGQTAEPWPTDGMLAKPSTPEIVFERVAPDGLARKLVLSLSDRHRIESVLMTYQGRHTGCLSTQVGCAMGCVFCATGQGGFVRNLSTAEIVSQVVLLNRRQGELGRPPLRNLVLMGMGEPLHNYQAVIDAIRILCDPRGAAIAGRHVTLSTVGLVPGIRRLADEGLPIHLAVSLHAATDAERARIVPAGRRWPLADLMDACAYYTRKRRRKVLFEWTMIAGETDTEEQARAVATLLAPLPCQINLIPLNPTAGYSGRPSTPAAVDAFRAHLAASGIPSSVRQRRAIEVAGGCGQLATASA